MINKLKGNKAITLIALIFTIIVLLVLAGVVINMTLGNGGILTKAQVAVDQYDKQEALEQMQMKVTAIQMKYHSEEFRGATLQEIADQLYDDDSVEYIKKGKAIASKKKITVAGYSSIIVKLNAYVYEFEIKDTYEVSLFEKIETGDSRITLTVTEINGDYARVTTSVTGLDESVIESYDYYEEDTLMLQNGAKENAVLHFSDFNEDYSIKVVLNLTNGETIESKYIDLTTGTRTYILKNGSQYNYITNGFSFNTIQNHSVSSSTANNQYYMYASSVYGVGYGEIAFYTNRSIDLSNYTKMYIDMDYSVKYGQDSWRVHFYYGLQKHLVDVPGTNSSSGTIISVNVNDTSDKVYFKCYSASANCPSWVRIRQIYFE